MNISDKESIRRYVRSLVKGMSADEKKQQSLHILRKVEALKQFRQAKIVLTYHSLPNEVYTHDFILRWYKKKIILLPVIQHDTLLLKEFTGEEHLRQASSLNIYEPQGDEFTAWGEIDFVMVPGMAFDHDNNRLGRGKGYYDRLLPGLNAFKTGVCFDVQYLKSVPVNENDVLVDLVIPG